MIMIIIIIRFEEASPAPLDRSACACPASEPARPYLLFRSFGTPHRVECRCRRHLVQRTERQDPTDTRPPHVRRSAPAIVYVNPRRRRATHDACARIHYA